MLKVIIVFLIFSKIIFADGIAVTVYCDEGFQPYSYVDNGVAKGLYVEVLQKAFSKMQNYIVKIEPVPWKRALEFIKTGDGFAAFPPYYRPKDRPWMDYSAPILDEELVLIVREDVMKKSRVKWPDDFTDLRIGINTGFMSLKDEERKKLNIEEARNTKMNLLKIGMGKIDGYINDKIAMLDTLKGMRAMGEYKKNYPNLVVGYTLRKESAYLGYTKAKLNNYPYKNDFNKELDRILIEMKKSGEINQIIEEFNQ